MDMMQKYREIEAMVSKLEYQIGEDHKTLTTISSLRKELGATIQVRTVPFSLRTSLYTPFFFLLRDIHPWRYYCSWKVLRKFSPNFLYPPTFPQYTDDGTPKSVENLTMFTEMYAKLALKKCQRTQLAAQLKQLGEV